MFPLPFDILFEGFEGVLEGPIVVLQIEHGDLVGLFLGRHVTHELLNEHLLGFSRLKGSRFGIGDDYLLQEVDGVPLNFVPAFYLTDRNLNKAKVTS